jgi:hypothetical protein
MNVRANKERSPVVEGPKRRVSIVEVSGKLSSPDKAEVHPTNLDFTNTATGQKFSAAIAKDKYSIKVPNHESYQVSITPGDQAETVTIATLVLNTITKAYTFDVSW